jgi:hypothetical protein
MTFEFNILFRFWFVIIFVVLAILCSLFVLYYLLFNRTLRQALNNHGIIVLLIIGLGIDLADVSFILNFFRFGSTWQLTTSFSQFWTFIDYGFYFFLHYLPIIIILTYCFIYYLTVVVFLSCEYLNDQSPINGVPSPCLYGNNVFFISWDLVCHQLIPTVIIVIFSMTLLVRVLYQKSNLCRNTLSIA